MTYPHMWLYIYVYICAYVCIHIYIHTYLSPLTFYYKLHVLTLFELSGLWHDILQYFAELNTIVS